MVMAPPNHMAGRLMLFSPCGSRVRSSEGVGCPMQQLGVRDRMNINRAAADAVRLQGPLDGRRTVVVSGLIAAVCAFLLAAVVPRGGDAAAHLYRTFLVERGALLWDNLWFAGQYPLASYSLLYYLPAAVVGNNVLGATGVVLSSALFASLVFRQWGRVGRWPAYAFAVFAGGQYFTGDYPYTLGFTALLAALVAYQRRRTWIAAGFAALTLGCSPLAFLFLCLALAALFLRSSRLCWRESLIALPLVGLAAIELAALAMFPSPLIVYPFTSWRLALGVPVGLLGVALSLRSSAGRPLASLFAVWTLATVASYLIRSPVGHNLLRPEALVFPLMLLAALLADFRPRWLAVLALAAALAANVGPYTATVAARADKGGSASFWRPLVGYVADHLSSDYRVEAVPTVNHWESYYLPKAGLPIARGWYEQLDAGDNPALYRRPLTGPAYRAWLRSVGVKFVILANTAPAPEGILERRLLLSGHSGLRQVFSGANGTIYELSRPTPILTGAAPAGISSDTHTEIAGWASRPGRYLLRVHWLPYWKLTSGAVCLRQGPGDMTDLQVAAAGRFSLHVPEVGSVLASLVEGKYDAGPICSGRE